MALEMSYPVVLLFIVVPVNSVVGEVILNSECSQWFH